MSLLMDVYLKLNDVNYATNTMSMFMITIGILVLLSLMFFSAPYGRYSSSSWGCLINGKVAWFVQELPCLSIPVMLIIHCKHWNVINCILLSLFIVHYIQRALIFPFLIQGGKPTPLIAFILALVFCLYNGILQSLSLLYVEIYPDDWFSNLHVIIGTFLFFVGMIINVHSDHVLRNLRKPGEVGYKIPKGGMFEYVSGANFLGEIVEWTGFAIACSSLSAVAFLIFTASNIGPRALQHHRWYKLKFEDYPESRKALIPFIL